MDRDSADRSYIMDAAGTSSSMMSEEISTTSNFEESSIDSEQTKPSERSSTSDISEMQTDEIINYSIPYFFYTVDRSSDVAITSFWYYVPSVYEYTIGAFEIARR